MRTLARKLYRAIPFKQPPFELLRRVVRVPEPIYRHLSFRGVMQVAAGERSFRMMHQGTQVENEVFWSGLFGRWEGSSLRLWVAAAARARSILDVGANTGLYALAAAAVAPPGTAVAALEPVERIRARLAANVALNPFAVTVLPAAAGDRDGWGTLLDTDETHELSATMDEEGAVLAGRPRRAVRVPTVRIDTLVAEGVVPPPDLLKIDVEGYEPAVLRGMPEALRSRPVMLVEVLSEAAADAVWAILGPHGYACWVMDADGPRPLERPRAAPGTNLLFCTPESARALVP